MADKTFNRRTAIGAAVVAASPLLFPGRVGAAQGKAKPTEFVVLLKGLYQPVVHAPKRGLSMVNLNDGSYVTVKIYPVSGTPGNTNRDKAIGDFYAQFEGDLCAYHIPGGSIAMQFDFAASNFPDPEIPDVFPPPSEGGGVIQRGTWELDVIEGTGIYKSFVGGRNHMEDRLHFLANGDVDELCTCFVSGP